MIFLLSEKCLVGDKVFINPLVLYNYVFAKKMCSLVVCIYMRLPHGIDYIYKFICM